jgi:type III protein arginine methyltransferase
MYGGSSKSDGAIIGIISKGSNIIDFDEAAAITAAEETLLGVNDAGDMIALNARISRDSGELVWGSYQSLDESYIRTVAMSQMTSMLRDQDRNQVYQTAINTAIDHFIKQTNQKPAVLDIGTGTGLLACLCAVAGASRVTGCEMFSPMAYIAFGIIEENGLSDTITVVEGKSSDLEVEDIAMDGYDMIVSELLDSSLLGESVIPSHLDAISRLLRPNDSPLEDRIIPHSACVYFAAVESTTIRNMSRIDRLGRNVFSPYRDEGAKYCKGGWLPVPIHLDQLADRNLLSVYTPAMSIKFYESNTELSNVTRIDIEVLQSGTVHAISMAWDLYLLSPNLDKEREIKYSTRPGQQIWQDHWLQMMYPLAEDLDCKTGDILEVQVFHDDIRIWCQVLGKKARFTEERAEKRICLDPCTGEHEQPQCSCGWHVLCGAESLQTLNDEYYFNQWLKAIHIVISRLKSIAPFGKKHLMYDLSDGSFLSMLSASSTMSLTADQIAVVSWERKQYSRLFYQQLTNDNDVLVWDGDDWNEVVQYLDDDAIKEEEEHEDVDDEYDAMTSPPESIKISCLMSECYSYQLHALPLHQAISFYFQRKALKSAIDLSSIIVPSSAKIMVAPIHLTDLQLPHGPVDSALGFSHRSYNDYIRDDWHRYLYPYKLGNYRKNLLAEPSCITTIDYVNCENTSWLNGETAAITSADLSIPFLKDGFCHGVALWVDYHLIDDVTIENYRNEDFPLYYNVILKFLPEAKLINASQSLHLTLRFEESELDVDLMIS